MCGCVLSLPGFGVLVSPSRGDFSVLSVLGKELVKTSTNDNEVLHLVEEEKNRLSRVSWGQ